MVHDCEPVGLDALQVKFDDERAVSDAGVMLVAMLAKRLGIEVLAGRLLRLREDRPGAANAGRKVMALIFAMVLGADCIDDCDLLRAGRTRRLLGGWLPAPSTLGTFLRAFTFGHVRQLDALLGHALIRAWRAGAGPGEQRLVVDVDSFVGQVCGRLKQGASYGYTKLLGYHPILATRADTREVLHIRLRKGSANTSRGMLRFTEELIARVDRAGAGGVKLLRADSGFWNNKVFRRLEQAGWTYSIGVRMHSPPSLAGFDGPTLSVSMDEAMGERAVQEWREWWLKAIGCELELKKLMSERLRSVGSKRPHRAELIACRARLEEPVGRVLPAVAQALRQPAHGWCRERKAWAARMQLPRNIGTVACYVADERGVPSRCLKAEVLLLLVEGAWWYHVRPSVLLCSVDVARDHALLARPLRESLISGLDTRE
jgi:Transposase DDE domain group 1